MGWRGKQARYGDCGFGGVWLFGIGLGGFGGGEDRAAGNGGMDYG